MGGRAGGAGGAFAPIAVIPAKAGIACGSFPLPLPEILRFVGMMGKAGEALETLSLPGRGARALRHPR